MRSKVQAVVWGHLMPFTMSDAIEKHIRASLFDHDRVSNTCSLRISIKVFFYKLWKSCLVITLLEPQKDGCVPSANHIDLKPFNIKI